jgi:hypothetical protein
MTGYSTTNYLDCTMVLKLRFKTDYEHDLWSGCSRLISNCIIFYNASILSRLLEHKQNRDTCEASTKSRTSHRLPGSTSISMGVTNSRNRGTSSAWTSSFRD